MPMKTKVLWTVMLLLSTGMLRAEVDSGRPCGGTPYDRYLGPVRQTLSSANGGASVDEVRAYLRTARRFHYYYDPSNPYTPQAPSVTEANRRGDCKAKSLWLASKMADSRTRYVIGKAKPRDKLSHAWLLWATGGAWLALDPTMESDLLNAERVVGRKLIANYSYTGSSNYQHPTYSDYVK
jgi:hypothetical protein